MCLNTSGAGGTVTAVGAIDINEIMYKLQSRTLPNTYPNEAKHLALRYILDAWEEAVYEGLESDCIATAAIFAALSDLIASYGEEPVAAMCERLPDRVRQGEFSVAKTKQ